MEEVEILMKQIKEIKNNTLNVKHKIYKKNNILKKPTTNDKNKLLMH